MAARSRLAPRRCGALRSDGTCCRAWAIRESDPPRCPAHRQPPENSILLASDVEGLLDPHGDALPSIEAIVADLITKQSHLSGYIDRCIAAGIEVPVLLRLFALHGQNASRLGRLLRDRLALEGRGGDELAEALTLAPDEVAQQLRIEWD
jgi:hypothetical protein